MGSLIVCYRMQFVAPSNQSIWNVRLLITIAEHLKLLWRLFSTDMFRPIMWYDVCCETHVQEKNKIYWLSCYFAYVMAFCSWKMLHVTIFMGRKSGYLRINLEGKKYHCYTKHISQEHFENFPGALRTFPRSSLTTKLYWLNWFTLHKMNI